MATQSYQYGERWNLSREYEDLLNSLDSIVWELDARTFQLSFVSKQAERLLGYPVEQWLTEPDFWQNHLHPEDQTWALGFCLDALRKREDHQFEYRMIAADGRVVWLQDRVRVIHEEGQPVKLRGLMVDITPRKHAEEELQKLQAQLVQVQKFEALGRLAGGIAHDFNNLLAIILGMTSLALDELPMQSSVRDNLDDVMKAGQRAKELVQQLLTFSRPNRGEPRPVLVQTVVNETLSFLRASLPANVKILSSLAREPLTVLADPIQLQQVLLNLCLNARDAMGEQGGELTLTLTSASMDPGSVSTPQAERQRPHVKLTVSDSGCGIAPEVLSKIFDPFFTTKPKGKGNGMGLAIVHGIVNSMGGVVTVESTPGRGSIFALFLPLVESSVSIPVREEAPVQQGHGRVLFVDDEENVAKLGHAFLKRLGYEPVVTTNSLEALAIFRRAPQAFTAVVTDHMMPHLTGEGLARELLRVRPGVPIVVCTGFSDTLTVQKAMEIGIRGYLMKPLSVEELGQALNRVIQEM